MPTSKPRIAITLEPRVYETIERLAQLQRKSRGSVVAELVTSIHEPLMRTVALLDAAQQAPEDVKAGLRGVIEGVESQLVGTVGGGLAQMDWLLGRMSKGPQRPPPSAERSEAPKGSKGHLTPVPVTRGSGRKKRRGKPTRKGRRS